jgi:hypothetical protein
VIVGSWRDGGVAWFDSKHVDVDPPSPMVERVLSKPATDFEPIEDEDTGMLATGEVRLQPGTERHARAALRKLPGWTTTIDDGA